MLSVCGSTFGRLFAKPINIQPLGARVLIELDKNKSEKVGSLYVPQGAQEQVNQGKVVAVGQGAIVDGKRLPMTLQVGQKVLMPTFGGQVVKYENKEYTIIDEENILAIFI